MQAESTVTKVFLASTKEGISNKILPFQWKGFKLKDKIKSTLEKSKRVVEDVGVNSETEDVNWNYVKAYFL